MILSMGTPMLIALGCIFALMGLIGFCGTLKKKSWMLLVFFIIVLIIFILQVIASVFILLPNYVTNNSNMKVTQCLKLVSIFYSFLTLGGSATAGFGIWSHINQNAPEVLNTVDNTLTMILSMGTPMLIALGCIFALMGLIGFCGTLKKKSWMLLVFFIIVLIIFILQVIASVFILLPNSVKENALSSLEVKFVECLQRQYEQDPIITRIWNETMTKLNCCGYKGYDDFTNSTFVKKHSEYPKQCCDNNPNSKCEKEKAVNKKVRGCVEVMFNENIPISGALAFLIGILEIVALCVSLKVYRCLRRLPDLPDPFDNL